MDSDVVYKKLMVSYLLLQEWKKTITSAMGSTATTRELIYMFDIYRLPGKSIGEYAEMNFVTPGTYTATHKSLLKKKLISIVRDRADNRIKLIHLTKQGTEVVRANLDHFQRLINRLEKQQGVKKTEAFVEVLDSATEIMRTRLQERAATKNRR